MPRTYRQGVLLDTELDNIRSTVPSAIPVPILEGGTGESVAVDAFTSLSPTTTKGDLVVTSASKNARLGVGTDGQVLTADSGSVTGVSWGSVGFYVGADASPPPNSEPLWIVTDGGPFGTGSIRVSLDGGSTYKETGIVFS